MSDEKKQQINELLARHGVIMSAVFVPQSASRNSQEKNHTINWRISFTRASNKASMALDYGQGIGHVPNYKQPRTIHDERVLGEPWETGKYNATTGKVGTYMQKRLPLPAPAAADLLYSITMDDTHGESFEEWCSNFGYDSDSRTAEATYEACKRQTYDAQRVLGSQLLEEAAKILEDY